MTDDFSTPYPWRTGHRRISGRAADGRAMLAPEARGAERRA